ncbi:YheV family putative zinc ribbon protein [Zobellella iuensis]|uniref:YheV family putative metal-binding protein n=1 Tax=Zobellella iuensis TaxID=2803811 RepID=A0ABS1QM95_9GAMM|nr:YheV family putative metal-binding protein [Zobellella iuensis]
METRRKKRFIAGAVCPRCQAMDTMMLYMEHGVEKVECISCGHSQSQTKEQISQAGGGEVIGVFKPE